ncbi:MAG: miaa: trna dimethylallyltransferase [Chthoniobacteraceae bacterium]|nr:miaa: trna dimethylallyltransferase [Chthoniobacteraceae bacterium]
MPSTFFILGPTASGKTALAIEAAALCDAEIVGADAFQIYRGLDILTAKPSVEERFRTPHHLVGEIALSQPFDVAQYAAAAGDRIREIHARGKHVLVVGGTGLYVRALTHGLADLPPADAALRNQLESMQPEELQACLLQYDPVAAAAIDLKNPRRVIRAVEVCILTGKPFSSFRQQWNTPAPHVQGIVLMAERTGLYERINRRTDNMFKEGVVEEVRDAGPIGSTAAQAIGLREIRACCEGLISKAQCIESIQLATRRYAKRQITWFRKETAFGAMASSRELAEQIARRVGGQL